MTKLNGRSLRKKYEKRNKDCKIDYPAWTAKIESAQITSAKISNCEITTLKSTQEEQ